MPKLAGRNLANRAPDPGQGLVWNGTTMQWEPSDVSTAVHTHVEADVTDLAHLTDHGALAGLGDDDHSHYLTPARHAALTGMDLHDPKAHTHAGGEITGLEHDAVKLQGHAVSNEWPSDEQGLVWNDTAQHWEPSAVALAGHYHLGYADEAHVHPALGLNDLTDTLTPSPSQGNVLTYQTGIGWTNTNLMLSDFITAQDHSFLTGADLHEPKAHTHAAVAHTHAEADITDLDHDALKLQGRTLANTAPSTGQILGWTGSQWQPVTPVTLPHIESGTFTGGGAGSGWIYFSATFGVAFASAPNVVATPVGYSHRLVYQITARSTTGFTIGAYDPWDDYTVDSLPNSQSWSWIAMGT